MNTQPSLFDAPSSPVLPPYRRNSVTSLAAAEAVRPKASIVRGKIMQCLLAEDLTPDELSAKTGEHILSVRPRCTDLKNELLVELTGVVRPSSTGRGMAVLRLTAAGRNAAKNL